MLAGGTASIGLAAPAATSAVRGRLEIAAAAPRLAGTTVLGSAPAHTDVEFDVALDPRNPEGLTRLLREVTTRGSAEFHHYLAPGEFRAEFGASAETTTALRRYFLRSGITSVTVGGNGLSLSVRGSARSVARALDTTLADVRTRTGARYTANLSPLSLPVAIAGEVAGIAGLDDPPARLTDDLVVARHGITTTPSVRAKAAPAALPLASGAVTPSTTCASQIANAYGTGDAAGYRADEIASAYGFNTLYATGDLGAGKTIALVEFSSFDASDISTYASCYGITPNVTPVLVDGGSGVSPAANVAEAELDIEDVLGLAPDARILVYEGSASSGTPSNTSAYDVYAAAVDQDTAQVISTSWGTCESESDSTTLKMENTVFEQAALQGQTVVAAAGDEGSEDCDGSTRGASASALAVDDPASQPYVTGVGGTTLGLSPVRTEVVWNTTSTTGIDGAGGGGASSVWPMPTYQSDTTRSLGVVTAAPGSSCSSTTGCREVPDISANAGTPYAIYCTLGTSYCTRTGWTGVGGTSAAAPLFAALVLLADASSACSTIGTVGFVNPTLYRVAEGAGYAGAFTDIVSGENDFTGTHGGDYPAAAGYDLASGLGTPIAGSGSDNGLVTDLCSPVGASVVTDSSGLPTPTVTKLVPTFAPPTGGERITITGTSLTSVVSVTFGTTTLLPPAFTILSKTKIVATVPPGTGRVHVVVTDRAGSSPFARANTFSYVARPLVRRLAPPSGPPAGGTTVVIIGEGFTGVRTVTFGGRPATAFTVRSSTRIVATAPAGNGSVHVVVVARGGRSIRGAANLYSYR